MTDVEKIILENQEALARMVKDAAHIAQLSVMVENPHIGPQTVVNYIEMSHKMNSRLLDNFEIIQANTKKIFEEE